MSLKISPLATEVEKAVGAEFNRLHVRAQAIRMARTFLTAFLGSVWLFHGAVDTKVLFGLAVSAAEGAVHEVWPQLPLGRVTALIEQFRSRNKTAAVTRQAATPADGVQYLTARAADIPATPVVNPATITVTTPETTAAAPAPLIPEPRSSGVLPTDPGTPTDTPGAPS